MNNDGNELLRTQPGEALTAENFLSKRTTPLIGSQVDSIFYCTGVFNLYFHQSRESEMMARDEKSVAYMKALKEQGTDTLQLMTDFGHKNNIEIFWSMRMNDTHDSGTPALFCEWKKQHPHYLVGKKGDKFPYGANRWSSVDYGVPEVREKVFRILADVCSRYDIDGIELDFFRHPVLFRAQMTGEPVTGLQREAMNELLRRIRLMTERTAEKRKRPLLIAIRIPDSVGYCRALGIDLTRWLKEDLVDIISAPGYFKLEPWKNLSFLGHKYDVPVYACLVKRRIQSAEEPEGDTAIRIWRGEALNAWRAGVNGIYTFNRFDPQDRIFREIGDPQLLQNLDRIEQTAYVNESSWSRPEVWLKDGRRFVTLD